LGGEGGVDDDDDDDDDNNDVGVMVSVAEGLEPSMMIRLTGKATPTIQCDIFFEHSKQQPYTIFKDEFGL
jgi:hypothetical protein